VKTIKTERDYRRAVARIDELVLGPDAETNEELDLLTILVMAYEADHVPEVPLDPIDYLKASMENRGLSQSDLARLLGSSSRAAEVLNGKRELQGDDPHAGGGMATRRQYADRREASRRVTEARALRS
jgi:HTH-type transcriptional regulator / antitoxin HigA